MAPAFSAETLGFAAGCRRVCDDRAHRRLRRLHGLRDAAVAGIAVCGGNFGQCVNSIKTVMSPRLIHRASQRLFERLRFTYL